MTDALRLEEMLGLAKKVESWSALFDDDEYPRMYGLLEGYGIQLEQAREITEEHFISEPVKKGKISVERTVENKSIKVGTYTDAEVHGTVWETYLELVHEHRRKKEELYTEVLAKARSLL